MRHTVLLCRADYNLIINHTKDKGGKKMKSIISKRSKDFKCGIVRQKQDGGWTRWARDNARNYPGYPNINDKKILKEWFAQCLEIAGLDWKSSYSASGYPFANSPYIWIDRKGFIQFRQTGGLDI